MAAEEVLAEKVALPQQVLIQDYGQSQHSNILGEVRFLTEAALHQTVTVNIGTTESANWVQVTPVYAVGAASKPFASKFFSDRSGTPRRPMPRASRSALKAEAQAIRPIESVPMGLVLLGSDQPIAGTGLLQSFGEGLNGPLVTVTGTLLESPAVSGRALDALASAGISAMEGIPVIVPYHNGLRVSATVGDHTEVRYALEWLSLGLILVGGALLFDLFPRPRKDTVATFQHVDAVGAFPGVFQPIRTQEDLVREEQERSEQEASHRRRKLSRIMHPAT